MKKRCRKSGKVKFDTSEQAWTRAGELINNPKKYGIFNKTLSAYRCPHCQKYHLTSQPQFNGANQSRSPSNKPL